MIGHWVTVPAHVQPADAIAVHGGGSERVTYGIELYHQGVAPELWLTGFDPTTPDTTEFARQERQRAIAAGVPAESIHLLATTSTWEDGREIAALAKERDKTHILVVTNWWHSRRAWCSDQYHLRGSGIALSFAAPPETTFHPATWYQSRQGQEKVLSELGKIGFYWLFYGLNPWICG